MMHLSQTQNILRTRSAPTTTRLGNPVKLAAGRLCRDPPPGICRKAPTPVPHLPIPPISPHRSPLTPRTSLDLFLEMSAPTVLSHVAKLTTVDVDSMDPTVSERFTKAGVTLCDMTSNQAMVAIEAGRPERAETFKAAIAQIKATEGELDLETQIQDAMDLLVRACRSSGACSMLTPPLLRPPFSLRRSSLTSPGASTPRRRRTSRATPRPPSIMRRSSWRSWKHTVSPSSSRVCAAR